MTSLAAHLLPPSSYSAAPQSPVETSPAASSTNIATPQVLLERSEIDKSLKSLENLVSLLYDYAQVWQSLVSLDKKLVKAFKDAGTMKRSSTSADGLEWPTNVFSASSLIFDSVSEVDSKYSKLVEREYESCTQDLKKWLKKLKKEDKALDEYTTAANAKIKAAGLAYEKKSKRGVSSSPSGPSLESYSALLSTLSNSVASAKHQHALFTSTRHITILYSVSGSIGRIADAQWMKTCELLRRSAANIGMLGEGRSYVESGWRGGTVYELPLNLPVESIGHGESSTTDDTIASRNYAAPRPSLPAAMLSTTSPTTTSTEQKASTTPMAPSQTESISPKPITPSSANVLERVTEELMTSMSLAETGTKAEKKPTTSSAKDDPDNTIKGAKPSLDSVKPSITSIEAANAKPSPKSEETTKHAATVASSTGTTTTSNTTGTTRSGGTETSASSSSLQEHTLASTSSESKDPVAGKAPPIPNIPSHTSLLETALFEPSNTLARTPLIQTKKESNSPATTNLRDPITPSPVSPKSSGPGTYFPPMNDTHDSSRPTPTPIFASRSTTASQSQPNSAQSQPTLPHAPASYAGRAIGRTMSIDSTTSNGSLVAAMRDRYNTTSPPPPPPPHPTGRRGDSYAPRSSRDGQMSPREREGGKVSDMASRFTPIEGPLPPSGSLGYGRPGFPVPTVSGRERPDYSPSPGFSVGDTLPIRTPLRRSSVDEFGSSFAAANSALGGGRRGGETMPGPDRRQTMMTPVGGGSSRGGGGPQTPYDIHLSELELQQREMELEIHRQRLQLAKEREAFTAREREREVQDGMVGSGGSDYHSGREGRAAYGDRYGRRDRDMGGEAPYAHGGYGRDVGYESPSGREMHSPSPRGYEHERTMDNGRNGNGTPRLGGGQVPDPYGDRDRDRDRASSRGGGGGGESAYHDMSTGLGVLGLGLPPGAAASSMGSVSRESLPLSPATNLSPPAPQSTTRARDPSPRRSAESGRPSEKEKGGTWLGKGLKRFSMPMGNGS